MNKRIRVSSRYRSVSSLAVSRRYDPSWSGRKVSPRKSFSRSLARGCSVDRCVGKGRPDAPVGNEFLSISQSLLRCTEFPCKSDCTSIENRGTFTIFSVYPTERAEHAIGPLTSGLRHEHGRRHVGGHVGRRSFFSSRHPFSSSTSALKMFRFVPSSK